MPALHQGLLIPYAVDESTVSDGASSTVARNQSSDTKIEVRYNNGDKIRGEFKDKGAAIESLKKLSAGYATSAMTNEIQAGFWPV